MNSPLFTSTPRQQQIGIAALRIILGIVMTAHGYQKLFTMGIAGVQGGYSESGWMVYGQHPVWTVMTLMVPSPLRTS